MPPLLSRLFSATDRDRIQAAVHAAEKATSGEIVPYVVEQCDEYEVAHWRGGASLALVTMIAVVVIHSFTGVWLPVDVAGVLIGTLAAFGIGAFAVRSIAPLKRFFAGTDLISRRVSQRAAAAFLSEEVFNTRERTGILLFLSILEHRVVVMGDVGINARVLQSDWDRIVATVIQGIRDNRPADGLIEAISQCGALLREKGIQIRPDDRDELDDSLRMSGR